MAPTCPLHVILTLASLVLSHPIVSAHCTANCVTVRREWPQLDFEFYHASDGSLHTSLLSYSVLSSNTLSASLYLTPSFSVLTSPSSPIATSSLAIELTLSPSPVLSVLTSLSPTQASASSNVASCSGQVTTNLDGALGDKSRESMLQNYLLRTVLLKPNDTELPRNLDDHLQRNLTAIYEYALARQRDQIQNLPAKRRLLSAEDSLNLTVWRLQVDNSLRTIDVIYYLQRDSILVPFEDAARVMSFVTNEFIRNQTGLEVLHKVRRYYTEEWSARRVATFDWLNWTSLAGLLVVLLLCATLVAFLYAKYRSERRKWLDAINRELNRVTPSRSQSEEHTDESHWNYGLEGDKRQDDDEQGAAGPSTSADKLDKASQYDYAPYSRRTSDRTPTTTAHTPTGTYRERLIPLGATATDNSDYDRISYVRTQETLHETKKHPNILEIQLSKETQSIVQEIRKELNRYNFKKIIAQDNSTSEA